MSNSSDDKNPLDALEKLLNQTKKAQGDASPQEAQTADQETLQDQAEAEKKQAQAQVEYEALAERSQQADEAKIRQQREALKQVKETPAYQARVEQEKQQQQAKEQEVENKDGYEIKQLEHKKI